MSRILLLQTIINKGACDEQVDLFRSKFGDSVDVTEALCESVASVFEWEWAAGNLLSAPAFKAYNDATVAAHQAYVDAIAVTLKAYYDATAPARKAYHDAIAPAFARAYIADVEAVAA